VPGCALAFTLDQREHLPMDAIFQPGQLVRVNLAGLDAGGVTFQAAVTDAVGHILKQTSEQPPKYLVELLFSFRGVSQVRSARRPHPCPSYNWQIVHMARLVLQRVPLLYNPKTGGDDGLVEDVAG